MRSEKEDVTNDWSPARCTVLNSSLVVSFAAKNKSFGQYPEQDFWATNNKRDKNCKQSLDMAMSLKNLVL